MDAFRHAEVVEEGQEVEGIAESDYPLNDGCMYDEMLELVIFQTHASLATYLRHRWPCTT